MSADLELLVVASGARVRLAAPDVGWWTSAPPRGALVTPGSALGVLVRLGRWSTLVVPDGVEGRIVTEAPVRVHAPVGYGDILCEIEALAASATKTSHVANENVLDAGMLVVRAPTSGRFWHRAAPNEPALASPGMVLRDGTPVGLIEVMKTFSHVVYRASGGLPARARVVRVHVADGGDVRQGDALLALEPAEDAR